MLKPQDIVFALKAHLWSGTSDWSFERLGRSIGLSASQAHASLHRMAAAGLYRSDSRSLRNHAFAEFAVHGVPHVFPVVPGELVMGMPTAHAAPPLRDQLLYDEAYVWPAPVGIMGRALAPLHPVVPAAASSDVRLYWALALIDAFRAGRARDRKLARDALDRLLAEPGHDERWKAGRRALGQATS